MMKYIYIELCLAKSVSNYLQPNIGSFTMTRYYFHVSDKKTEQEKHERIKFNYSQEPEILMDLFLITFLILKLKYRIFSRGVSDVNNVPWNPILR